MWDNTLQGFGARRQTEGTVFLVGAEASDRWASAHADYRDARATEARTGAQFRRSPKGSDCLGHRSSRYSKAAERAQRTQKKQIPLLHSKMSRGHMSPRRLAKPNLRAWPEVERIFEKYVIPVWSGRPVTEITRRDVTALLDKIEDRNGRVMADRALAQIRRLFNWWASRDEQFRSPIVFGMGRVRPRDIARDRVLTDDEIRALWIATEKTWKPSFDVGTANVRLTASDVFSSLVRFLLLTGQRRDDAADAKWSDILRRNMDKSQEPIQDKVGPCRPASRAPNAHP